MNLEEYYDDIYRYCFFRMQDHSLAEDLTQEAFLKFLETSTYHDRGKPLAFLYTIARNLCIDHIRHKKTRPESVINCDISIFSDAAHSTEGTAFSPLHPSRSLRTHQLFWFRLCRPSVNPTGRSSACAMYWS